MELLVVFDSPSNMTSSLSLRHVAVVGATGAVGKEMINCLYRLGYPFDSLFLFASEKSKGTTIETPDGSTLTVSEFSVDEIVRSKCRIVLLAVSGTFSEQFSPALVQAGCIVIDNSSAFRYMETVPLVVPSLNGLVLKKDELSGGKIIANPNCTSAISAMVLFPLHMKFGGIKRLIASTYQAASGAGEPGMAELSSAIAAHASGTPFTPTVFSHNLCSNVIPCIDTVQPNGYTKEEMKLVWETQKIFNNKEIEISCTAVRVPTMRAHCISASIEFNQPVSVDQVREILVQSPGVVVVDNPGEKIYPVPTQASGKDDVFVGRIRQNLIFKKHGIDVFICGDQLLRGAALNAVEIAALVNKILAE